MTRETSPDSPQAAQDRGASEGELAELRTRIIAVDDELIRLWDAPVVTPALRWGG